MSKRAFDKIMQGIKEAGAYLDGSADKRRYRVHVPAEVNVKKIRRRLGLSQEAFAETYGFALSAVRDWEQGRRRPERSARILLKIVEKEPEAVTRALAGGGGKATLLSRTAAMAKAQRLPPIPPGEILAEEFMKPNAIGPAQPHPRQPSICGPTPSPPDKQSGKAGGRVGNQ